MVGTNVLTSWLTNLGPLGPNYFLGLFELVVFILLIFKEKYGAIFSFLFFTVLSILVILNETRSRNKQIKPMCLPLGNEHLC